MHSGFVSNTNLRDRRASSYRCQRSTIGAVLKLLFTLFEYHADYFSYYADYLNNTNGVSGEYSLCKSVSMISGGGAEAVNYNSSSTTLFPCPMDGRPLLLPGSIRVLEVFINLLGGGGTLVLPHVIRKTQINTYLNSQNNEHNMHNYHNTYICNNSYN
jgi:hypothetical protein